MSFTSLLLLQDQFPAHALAPRAPMLPPRDLPANIPWDATTSYQDTYKAYELQPRAPPAPVQAPKSTAKFDGALFLEIASSCCTVGLESTLDGASPVL